MYSLPGRVEFSRSGCVFFVASAMATTRLLLGWLARCPDWATGRAGIGPLRKVFVRIFTLSAVPCRWQGMLSCGGVQQATAAVAISIWADQRPAGIADKSGKPGAEGRFRYPERGSASLKEAQWPSPGYRTKKRPGEIRTDLPDLPQHICQYIRGQRGDKFLC